MNFPYISRKKAEQFIKNVETAIKNPSDNPLLHYAYGIGGIGKTTLIKKLIVTHKSSFQCAKCSFDVNSPISTPIELMKILNEQLPDLSGWEGDYFQALYDKWQKALKDLEAEINKVIRRSQRRTRKIRNKSISKTECFYIL